MPKFIITEVTRYEVEADSIQELREDWQIAGLDGAKYEYVILDGSTTYAPIQEGEN
jgi:hypothetical protein